MKYCGHYCNIQVKQTHQLLTSLQRKTAHMRKGSYALHVLLKMQLYLVSNSFIIWNQNEGPTHMLPPCRICIKPHRIITRNKATWQNGIWCSPNLSVPLGGGGRAGPLFPLSSPVHRTALGSDELPHSSPNSCNTAILALAPRAPLLLPLFFLIQTHHQSPLPIAKFLMSASP